MISGNVWSVSGFSLVPTSEGRDDFFSATLDMFSLLGVGAKKIVHLAPKMDWKGKRKTLLQIKMMKVR